MSSKKVAGFPSVGSTSVQQAVLNSKSAVSAAPRIMFRNLNSNSTTIDNDRIPLHPMEGSKESKNVTSADDSVDESRSRSDSRSSRKREKRRLLKKHKDQ